MYEVVFNYNNERSQKIKTFDDIQKAREFCEKSRAEYTIDYNVFVEYSIYQNDKMIENFYKKKLDNYKRV